MYPCSEGSFGLRRSCTEVRRPTEVLEDKRKMTLLDRLSHGRAEWPDAGITTSHIYVCCCRASHPHGSTTLRRDQVSLGHPPNNVRLPSSTGVHDANFLLLIDCQYIQDLYTWLPSRMGSFPAITNNSVVPFTVPEGSSTTLLQIGEGVCSTHFTNLYSS